jgi:hypothetical protein
VPGAGLGGLAVSADRVYVPNSEGAGVAVVDRSTGRLLRTLPIGRRPLGIALGA